MNPKQNDSQAEVNDNDIVIEENPGNNKPDVPEGVTAEPNYETPLRKQGFFSTKNGKKVLFGIIGVVFLAILITILVILLKPKCKIKCEDDPNKCCDDFCKKNPDQCPPFPPCEGENCPCEGENCPCEGENCPCDGKNCPIPDDNIVFDINYKKNDVYLYEEKVLKVSNIELSNSKKNGRLLEDNSRLSEKSTITSKYLINIYDYDEKKETYYAYAAVIDMNKQVESQKSEKIGGKDLTKSSSVEDDVPVANFTFDKYGTILTFEPNGQMEDVFSNSLYEFVQRVIPEVSKKSFPSNQFYDDRKNTNKDKRNGEINDKTTSDDEDNDNKEVKNWKTTIKNGRVTKTEGKKEFSLNVNYERQFKNNTGNFTEDIETDQSVNRGTLIKQIKNDYTSTITLSNNTSNEELTKKINNLLKNVKFPTKNNRNLADYEKKINNLRYLQETNIADTYSESLHFFYPLFKSNLVGATVGLIADVVFMPMDGKFYIKMNFDANGKLYNILNEEKQTNFNKIYLNIREILNNIYIVLYEDAKTVQPIFDEFQSNITNSLAEFYSKIQILPQLKTEEFKYELERILFKIKETTANTYTEVYQSINKATKEYNTTLTNIQNGEESFVTSIKTTSSNTVEDFIEKNKDNLEKLFTAWTTFYNDVKPELEEKKKDLTNNPNLIFDIGLYYNIKDEMNAAIKVYKEFSANLESSLNIEHNKFTSEVNEKFNTMIGPSLLEAEKIATEAETNTLIKEAMNQGYTNGEGDKMRTHMIDEIKSLRKTLDDIIKQILSQISVIYKSNVNSQAFISFQNSLVSKYDIMMKQQAEILEFLREFNKYDISFDIYFDDIKILNELEIEVYNLMKTSYKKYIGDYISSQSEYSLLQSEVKEIRKTITNYFDELQQYADELKWTDAKEFSKTFITTVKTINQKYLTEEFAMKIVNYYTDKTFINKMFDNYYKDLYNHYKKFNTTFYEQYYLKHAPDYVSKPTELINKLLDISYNLNPENSQLHITVQELIETKIITDISTITTTIYQIIYEEYNKFIQNIYNRDCCVNGYNNANIQFIINNLNNFSKLYYDEDGKFIQIYNYTRSTKEDAFNLKIIINQKTNEIKNNILRIVDQINIDFHDTFCYGIQIYCQFINVVGQLEHYYYQASKLRVSLKFIQSLVAIAQSMITENILIDLKPENYEQLFKLELNYKETEILTDIKSFLAELNVKTTEYISGTIIKVQSSIKSYFESGITEEYIKNLTQTIAHDVFQDEFSYQIEAYFAYACGTNSKISQAFTEEINFHKILSENKWTFYPDSYETSYQNKIIELIQLYNDQKNQFLNNLQMPDLLVDNLKKKVKDFISESYKFSNEKINSLTGITNFEFLNMEFSLKDITNEALSDVIQNLYSKLNNNILTSFKNEFDNFKKNIKKLLEDSYDEIIQYIDIQYNSTYKKYKDYGTTFSNISSVSYNYNISQIQDSTVNILSQTIITFFAKVKEVYSDSNLLELFSERLTKSISTFTFTFNNQDLTKDIRENILELYTLSHQRLVQEKTLFQKEIRELYLKAFNVMITQFVNGKGKDYLLNAVNFDYENTIYHDFSLMKSAISQTYYTVKTLLDVAELRSLGFNLILTFNEIFPEIRDKINNIIPNRIEKVIYPKIMTFKNEANNLITKLFISTLENERNNLKGKLSEKVYELIPTQLDSSFKGIIQNNFNNAIQNIIEDIKQTYNTKILTDLENISKVLSKYGDEITYAVNSAYVTETATKWLIIEKYYKKLIKVHKEYDTNSVLEIESQKTTEIESFINTRIITFIQQIINEYTTQIESQRTTMNTVLENFKINSLVDSTYINIQNSNLLSVAVNYKSTFDNLFDQFITSLTNKFKDFPKTFNEEIKEIEIKGFDKRNLGQEYYLTQIEETLFKIEKKYEALSTKIKNNSNYAEIERIISSLPKNLNVQASTLTNSFYAYQILIQQYTDNNIIEKYFEKLETDAKEIQSRTFDFVMNTSNAIQKVIDIIYNRRTNSWYEIRTQINNVIYKTLDEVFKDKFSNLKDLTFASGNNNKKTLLVDPIYVTYKDGESLNTITFNITDINYKYGYSLKKDGDYNFKMNVFTEGDITLDIISSIGDRIVEKISGKLGSGKIGLNANYTLSNKQVDYEAYAKVNEVEYDVEAKSKDGYTFYKTKPLYDSQNISMKKEFKNKITKFNK